MRVYLIFECWYSIKISFITYLMTCRLVSPKVNKKSPQVLWCNQKFSPIWHQSIFSSLSLFKRYKKSSKNVSNRNFSKLFIKVQTFFEKLFLLTEYRKYWITREITKNYKKILNYKILKEVKYMLRTTASCYIDFIKYLHLCNYTDVPWLVPCGGRRASVIFARTPAMRFQGNLVVLRHFNRSRAFSWSTNLITQAVPEYFAVRQ